MDTDMELSRQIDALRAEMGSRLLILGHHYQRSAVLRHADELGDSLELARKAAARRDASRIVFCGVRFMAESADILTGPEQTVYMPEVLAGCPMADMADAAACEAAWQELGGGEAGWVPVVYVNSSAAVKAFCGAHGGSACTSSNAAAVFRWVLDRGKRVLFLPDEHLGRNTAADLGVPDDAVGLYDPRGPRHGAGAWEAFRVVVWKGFCLVHTAFSVEAVRRVRAELPEAKIIVHPEAPREVVALSDAHGSTSQIIRYVEQAPDGATIVIGTELNLVQRLAETHAPRVRIAALSPSVCANMAKTNERNLLRVLQDWPAANEVHVPRETAANARAALEQMLAL